MLAVASAYLSAYGDKPRPYYGIVALPSRSSKPGGDSSTTKEPRPTASSRCPFVVEGFMPSMSIRLERNLV